MGYTLTKRNAKWYTTKERYEKVLDNFTHPRIDFPASSFMVVLYARYKTENYDEFEFIPKFAFIIDDNITIKEEEHHVLYKSTVDGKKYSLELFFPYRLFKTKEELLTCLGELIKYFHENDLSMYPLK